MNDGVVYLLSYLILPVLLIVVGLVMWRFPPGYGGSVGYRTKRRGGLGDEAFPQQPAGVGFRAGVLGKADSGDEHSYAGCFRGRWSVSDSKAAERGGRSAGVLRYYDASACSAVCEHRGHGIGFEKALLIGNL